MDKKKRGKPMYLGWVSMDTHRVGYPLPSLDVVFNLNGKWDNRCLSRALKNSTVESKPFPSIYNQSPDASKIPAHAMEFLCRSWTSSASDFQQIFSSSNLVLPLNACGRIEEHEEGNAEEETLEKQVRKSGYITNKMDNTWMDFNHMKGSLKLKPLTQIFRSRSKKKKEEFRLHTAKLHAALSLTQLAAAIAGFATSGTSTEAQQDHIEHITSSRASTLALWDQDAGVVVASAAALLTTVCAEAAESLGAKRAHVASAVKSGLATQTPVDMVTLTATAATCLKGAATLKSRAKAGTDLPRNQELLRVGAQISIVMPSDMIINVIEESKDIKGIYSLILKTNKGIAKLLFEDEKQSSIWVSTISNLLQMHNSC
ncbi:hypothetical protein TEA_006458 [Camellia sinensis var. sinensis]|uniref:VAN3-binding protein-like auxin canalisation domain-containing protein n=1 Tax=Camellia sinensis var. sinensis TaxID=542762 RepID=A0A4S4F399_CAMSN|nr:hypothetical protein TEA_006458 [Camellia sinensis var. sinensis]